jgi:hypothetical protein
MTLTARLTIGILVGAIGFSSVAMAAKKPANANKTFRIIGHIVNVDREARQVTVQDNYTNKLYKVSVPKDFRLHSLTTSAQYLPFEQLHQGILVSVEVRSTNSESARVKTR